MAIKAINGDLCVMCNVYNKYWCLVQKILVVVVSCKRSPNKWCYVLKPLQKKTDVRIFIDGESASLLQNVKNSAADIDRA
jgi:hypothetical protein